MKVFVILLLSVFLFHNLHAQSLKKTYYDPWKETKIKEKYYVNSKNQKHGKYIKYDDRGLKAVEIQFNNGKPHGVAKEYALPLVGYPGDERVKTVAKYVNGNQHGKTSYFVYIKDGKQNIKEGKKILQGEEYYKSGKKVREIAYFIDGSKEVDAYLKNGKQRKWYDNGQLAVELHVEDGVFNGSWKEWYTNGQIGVEGQKKSGQWFGEKKEWYSNGNLKEVHNYGERDTYGEIYSGIQIYYDSLGRKAKEENYSNLDNNKQKVQATTFYKNGKKKSMWFVEVTRSRYPKETFLPLYKTFHKNGAIAEKGQITKKGQRDGLFKFYNTDSELVGEYKYDNGLRVGMWTIYYDSDWNEVPSKDAAHYTRKVTFDENGKPLEDQLVKDYYINGNMQFEGYLYDIDPDIKNGFCKFYHKNGKLEKEGYFKAFEFRGNLYDLPSGEFTTYSENGVVASKGDYKIFNRPDGSAESFKIYDWFYYNINGKIDSVEIYKEKHGETIVVNTLNNEQAEKRERKRRELEAKKKKYENLIIQGDSLMTNSRFTEAKKKYELAKNLFPDNPESQKLVQEADAKHNNLVKSTKVFCDSITSRVERAYVGTNSLLSSLADKKVKKVEKKKLYKGFVQVLEHYENQISYDKSSLEVNEINKHLSLLEKRMLKLRNDETKDLEKSIRKADDVQEIIELLNLEDK